MNQWPQKQHLWISESCESAASWISESVWISGIMNQWISVNQWIKATKWINAKNPALLLTCITDSNAPRRESRFFNMHNYSQSGISMKQCLKQWTRTCESVLNQCPKQWNSEALPMPESIPVQTSAWISVKQCSKPWNSEPMFVECLNQYKLVHESVWNSVQNRETVDSE